MVSNDENGLLVSPEDSEALAEALIRDGRGVEALANLKLPEGDSSDPVLLADAWLARAEVDAGEGEGAIKRLERVLALFG